MEARVRAPFETWIESFELLIHACHFPIELTAENVSGENENNASTLTVCYLSQPNDAT